MSNNNAKFKMIIRNNLMVNNKYLNKLNETEHKALEKSLEYLEIYNQDISYISLMPYMNEPRILYNKLKEYYID
jgi:hypothetical protein